MHSSAQPSNRAASSQARAASSLVGKYPSARWRPSPVLLVIRARYLPETWWNATPRYPDAPTFLFVPLLTGGVAAGGAEGTRAAPSAAASPSPTSRRAGSIMRSMSAMGWSSAPSLFGPIARLSEQARDRVCRSRAARSRRRVR